ncbi:hypothetical protein [Fibrella arboris]|uniref:hypothetical protein n=1 Tax=Fibrella arboris TaxID=3242486 RepID=UPI0035224156
MKTDPFDDAIRRKLEGVNPPFQEKNWTQFQRFMGSQGFPPSLWQTPARWLQPALMAAAVTGMVLTTVWQYRTTQSLTEHVLTLTKTVERLEQTQIRLQQSANAATPVGRIDTVYLTQAGPAAPMATRPTELYAGQGDAYGPRASRQRVESTDQLPTQSGEATVSLPLNRAGRSIEQGRGNQGDRQVRRPVDTNPLAANQPVTSTRQLGAGRTQSATDQPTVGQDELATPQPQSVSAPGMAERFTAPNDPAAREKRQYPAGPAGTVSMPPESGRIATRRAGQAGLAQNDKQSVDYQSTNPSINSSRSNDPTLYSPSVTNQVRTQSEAGGNALATTASGPLATVQPLSTLPMADPTDAFSASWQRHLRRVRYRSPYMTSTEQMATAAAPQAPSQHTTPVPVTFRLGIGAEVGTAQSGLGLYGEAIIANRWVLGTGLGYSDWSGDTYSTEQMFEAKTKRDFRRDYPGTIRPIAIGPGRPPEVTNISRVGQALVIPLQLGYRINLGTTTALTPFTGLNMGINPRETVTYSYEYYGPREAANENLTIKRPLLWYSTWSAGVSIERQWGRITGQVSPVVLVPLTATEACLNTASLGMRGRLFYRF